MSLCVLYFSSSILFWKQPHFTLIYPKCLNLMCSERTSSQGARVHMSFIGKNVSICIISSVPSAHWITESKFNISNMAGITICLCHQGQDPSRWLQWSFTDQTKNSRITCEGQILRFMFLCPNCDRVRKEHYDWRVKREKLKIKQRKHSISFSPVLRVVIFPS